MWNVRMNEESRLIGQVTVSITLGTVVGWHNACPSALLQGWPASILLNLKTQQPDWSAYPLSSLPRLCTNPCGHQVGVKTLSCSCGQGLCCYNPSCGLWWQAHDVVLSLQRPQSEAVAIPIIGVEGLTCVNVFQPHLWATQDIDLMRVATRAKRPTLHAEILRQTTYVRHNASFNNL